MEKTTSTRTNIWHLITILNHLKMITKILQNFTCSLSLFLLPIAPMTMEEIDSMEKDWMKATQTHRLKTDRQTNESPPYHLWVRKENFYTLFFYLYSLARFPSSVFTNRIVTFDCNQFTISLQTFIVILHVLHLVHLRSFKRKFMWNWSIHLGSIWLHYSISQPLFHESHERLPTIIFRPFRSTICLSLAAAVVFRAAATYDDNDDGTWQ